MEIARPARRDVDVHQIQAGGFEGPADGGCVLFADPANGRVQVQKLGGKRLDDTTWRDLVKGVVDS